MKKNLMKVVLAIFAIASVVSFSNLPLAKAADYDYGFVSQSAYPTVAKGGQATLTITLKNTGGIAWYNYGTHPTRLATAHDQDRASVFATAGNWASSNRINMTESVVYPGQNGTFTFVITAPNSDGTYREYFQPVIEDYQWLNDIGIYLDITVGAGGTPPANQQTPAGADAYSYQFVTQSAYPTLKPGATAQLQLTIKNTGTATWAKTGANALHLGTSSPQDRNSGFYNNSWLATNRIAMDQDSVAPGANATFTFNITGYSQEGIYKEYFRPVAEGITGWRTLVFIGI